ncbi:unnamed protein product [Effrenium voratum]|nr:unnamed protein product [Effrenium voratum]
MLRQPTVWSWGPVQAVPVPLHAPNAGLMRHSTCQLSCKPWHGFEKLAVPQVPRPDPRAVVALAALRRLQLELPRQAKGQKWHGVNYGNRFIPEDWMRHPYNFFQGLRRSARRVALWDLSGPDAKRRMLSWLDETIQEWHFAEMQSYGVEVLRVPCGYWNWMVPEQGPEVSGVYATNAIRERLRNLHRIARPAEYQEYFDRIFHFAEKYGIQVLLDLHAVPGSQNGEIHSGVCIESGEENVSFFQNEANLKMAVQAVREMARYARSKSNLFGVQVISEPHLHSDEGHEFLRQYYHEAILAAREFLDASVPIMLFEWTYEMHRWDGRSFPEQTYGRVFWDTHLYHFPDKGKTWTSQNNGLEQAKESYAWDLQQLRHFARQETVLVGEFSMAGPCLNQQETQQFAQWLVEQFDFACAGSLMWSFDNRLIAWSMQRQVKDWGFNWKRLFDNEATRCGGAVGFQAAAFGTWLSATEKGAVEADALESNWWEEWVPYNYRVQGKAKVALRSAAHGTWLSVTKEGEVTQSDHRSAWEEFSVLFHTEQEGQQCISLQSFHGSWLSVRRFRPSDRLLLQAAYSIHDAEVATAWLVS